MTGTLVTWDEALLGYDMGDHPLDPVRVELTMALARELGVLDRPSGWPRPRPPPTRPCGWCTIRSTWRR